MALEDRGAQHDKVVVDKFHNPNADYTMNTYDYVLRPAADGDSGAITITLPRVAEAKGRWYSIVATNADGTNTITVQDRDDSEYWQADITLNGAGDRALLYSDGRCWHPMGNPGEWPGFATTGAPGTSEAPSTAAPTTQGSTTAAPTTA